MKFVWLTLLDPATNKKKMKKVMILASAAKEITLDLLKKMFFDVTVVEFYETKEAGI